MDNAELEKRLVDLEVKLSFQDVTVEMLNQIVTAQQKQIEKLTDRAAAIASQLQNQSPGLVDGADTKPPHY